MKNTYEGLDEYVVKTVLIKANQLIGKAGYRREDYDDIVQEIFLDVCVRLQKYDPQKSKFETFVSRIVERKIADMIRAGNTGNRDLNRRAESLNESIELEDGTLLECIQTVEREDLPWNDGAVFEQESDQSDFKADLHKIITLLSPGNQKLCVRLTRENIAEICRDTGISRSAQYDHIRQIRKRLKEAGFENYLERPRHFSGAPGK